ncbi:MAG: hypothetical protein RR955_02055 [Raoultibacter sp.]
MSSQCFVPMLLLLELRAKDCRLQTRRHRHHSGDASTAALDKEDG